MKRRGFTFIEGMAILAIAGTTAALLYPALARSAEDNKGQCQGNLRQIALGVLQYNQDYDEKYPLVGHSSGSNGWANALQPYLRNTGLYQCPSEKRAAATSPEQPGYTDYWYSRNVAGTWMGRMQSPFQIIMMGDGDGGSDDSDARYSLNALPSSWRQIPGSPSRRHLDGANYAFADGHYKWIKPQQVTMATAKELQGTDTYTFAVR